MTFTLRFLSAGRFGGFVRWLEGDGHANDEAGNDATAIIHLNHPQTSGPVPFYAKFYPDLAGRSRALANEIAGYVLADRWSLPQPSYACIHRVPLKKLDLAGLPKRHGWIKDQAKQRADWPAFCTLAINHPTPYHHFGEKAQDAMAEDLRRWELVTRTIAFDDIVANIDRHFNNLLRIGEARYALIDHGRLVVADGHWTGQELDPDLAAHNRLLAQLYADPKEISNHIIAQADTAAALLSGFHELDHWLTPLLHNERDTAAFHNFLQTRTLTASKRIAKRYGLC